MSNIIEVTTTLGSESAANELARKLVEARLAACVQITGPIQSVYRWQGSVHEDREWRCTIKSLSSLLDSIRQFIRQHHPYQTPEILATSVLDCGTEYANWLYEQVDRMPDGTQS